VLAGEHDSIPGLDDMSERPQVPGRPGCIQRSVQFLLEPAAVRVRVRQRRTHQLDPLRQVLALLIRLFTVMRHLHPFLSGVQPNRERWTAVLGRQCIGVELEPRWGEVARTNLSHALHGM
jgi:hypothetical protein